MNKTKKKIILNAIELFNKNGISNVSNQDIANLSDITLSNFNYHFGNKKELVLAVMKYLGELLESQVYGKNSSLTLEGHGYEMAKTYFEFEKEFRFFFLETYYILLTYPELKTDVMEQVQSAIQIIKNVTYISIGKGFVKPAPSELPDLYERLAKQIWTNNHFHSAQSIIRGETGDIVEEGLKSIYFLYYPYLTETGKEEFNKYLVNLSTL